MKEYDEYGQKLDGMTLRDYFAAKYAELPKLEQFADLVRNAALDEAAATAKNQHVGASVDDKCHKVEDRYYNMALRHAAGAIRNLKTEQETK